MMTLTTRKTVSFNPLVEGIQVMSIYDYKPSEIAAVWYSEEEMEQITRRCIRVIQKAQAQGSQQSSRYCTRGLESHFPNASIKKKKTRSTSIVAVLDEQCRQRVENRFDDQAIADAYSKTTFFTNVWAHLVAKHDQEAAEAIQYTSSPKPTAEQSTDDLDDSTQTNAGRSTPTGTSSLSQQLDWEVARRSRTLHAGVA